MRFYARGRIRGIRVPQLAEIPTRFHDIRIKKERRILKTLTLIHKMPR